MSIQIIVEIEEHNGFPYEKPAPSIRKLKLKGQNYKLSNINDDWFEKRDQMEQIDEKEEKKGGKKDGKTDDKKKSQRQLWKIVKTKRRCIYKVRNLKPGEIFGHDEFVDHFENVL